MSIWSFGALTMLPLEALPFCLDQITADCHLIQYQIFSLKPEQSLRMGSKIQDQLGLCFTGVLRCPLLSSFPYKDTQNQKCPYKSLQGLKPVLFLLNLDQNLDLILVILIEWVFFPKWLFIIRAISILVTITSGINQ